MVYLVGCYFSTLAFLYGTCLLPAYLQCLCDPVLFLFLFCFCNANMAIRHVLFVPCVRAVNIGEVTIFCRVYYSKVFGI